MAVNVEEVVKTLNASPEFILTSDKLKSKYTVKKTFGGFSFWEITVDVGKLPAALSGFHTSHAKAITAFEEWEAKQSKSRTVKVEENRQAREEQKAS